MWRTGNTTSRICEPFAGHRIWAAALKSVPPCDLLAVYQHHTRENTLQSFLQPRDTSSSTGYIHCLNSNTLQYLKKARQFTAQDAPVDALLEGFKSLEVELEYSL